MEKISIIGRLNELKELYSNYDRTSVYVNLSIRDNDKWLPLFEMNLDECYNKLTTELLFNVYDYNLCVRDRNKLYFITSKSIIFIND